MLDKLRGIEDRYENLTQEMGQPEVLADYQKLQALAKERASFQPAKDAGGQPMASLWMGSPMFLGPPFPGGGRR